MVRVHRRWEGNGCLSTFPAPTPLSGVCGVPVAETGDTEE